ncbi:MAG: hypothetical protein M3044_18790 [Thermoproteota archaeon]|nr:hypothetical protein [Thermoproteota archaeon]
MVATDPYKGKRRSQPAHILNMIKRDLSRFGEVESPPKDSRFEVLAGSSKTPQYMVRLLLFGLMRFKNYGTMDKVLWHTYLNYKGFIFGVVESRWRGYTIQGIDKNETTVKLAKQIQGLFDTSCDRIDPILQASLEESKRTHGYYLNNSYNRLFSIYAFYKREILKAVEDHQKAKNKKVNPMTIGKYLNEVALLEDSISNNTFALMSAFYSLLDFSMTAMYVLKQPNGTERIRTLKFKEQFKQLFPVNSDKQLKDIYDSLVKIKDNYRNPLMRGLLSWEILVPFPYIGLIPLSFKSLDKVTYRDISVEEAVDIVNTFQTFLDMTENKIPYAFYNVYLESGLSIPMNSLLVTELTKEMTSLDAFKGCCDAKVQYWDALQNRDVFL